MEEREFYNVGATGNVSRSNGEIEKKPTIRYRRNTIADIIYFAKVLPKINLLIRQMVLKTISDWEQVTLTKVVACDKTYGSPNPFFQASFDLNLYKQKITIILTCADQCKY